MSKTPSQIADALRPIVSNDRAQIDESRPDRASGASPDELRDAVREGVREGFEAYRESDDEHSSAGAAAASEDTTDAGSSSGRRRLLTLTVLATAAYLFRRRRRSGRSEMDATDHSQTVEEHSQAA